MAPDDRTRRLEESEARYRALFEHARDALLLADDEGRYVDVNPAASTLLGFSRDEFLRMSVWDLMPSASIEEGRRLWSAFLAAGQLAGEIVLRRRDGSSVPVSFNAVANVRPGEHLSVNRDISDVRRATGRLRDSEDWLARVIHNVSDVVTVLDARGTVVYESPSIRRALGYEPDELAGRNAFEYVHPEDVASVAEAFDLARTDIVLRYYRFRHKDGSWRAFEAAGQAYDGPGGERLAVVVSRDITELERAQTALYQSQALLRSIVTSAPLILFAMDRDGVLTLSEGKGLDAFGLKPGAHVGESVFDLYSGYPLVLAQVRRALAGEAFNESVEVNDRLLEAWYTPQRNAQGDLVAVLGVATDITERRQLEEQLRQAQKLESVGLLAGGIAHDFNNMLTAITGYAELIIDRLPSGDAVREEATEIARAAEKAALLTYQLLAFSRKQILRPKRLSLNDVVSDVSRMLRRVLGEHIAIVTRMSDGLGLVDADPGQLSQVILNLAVNARDAMPDGGTLTIETADADLDAEHARTHDVEPGRYVRLAVSDTGTGMTPEVRKRIFEPFFTTKGVGRGTGMGLATVYGIVKQSGGHISVSTEVGQGSAFVVYLPRFERGAATPERPPQDAAYARGHETILLVEDEEVVRRLTRRGLESCGYRVFEAADGAAAVAMYDRADSPIDLLLTDVVMPRMSGRELVEKLRLTRPHLRVLYMSGYTDDAAVHRGVVDEETNFIQKPFTMRALAQKARDILDGPAGGPPDGPSSPTES